MEKRKVISISLPEETAKTVEKIRKKKGMTRSEFFRYTLRKIGEDEFGYEAEHKTDNSKLKKFIKSKPNLVWYVKNVDNLSIESIVEHTLNYGDWDDIKELINVLGIKTVASIFKKQITSKRNNYKPEIINYFNLFFKKNA
jgi:metal-responsive CopG/Arc/MetJ family transcriptional regulator